MTDQNKQRVDADKIGRVLFGSHDSTKMAFVARDQSWGQNDAQAQDSQTGIDWENSSGAVAPKTLSNGRVAELG